MIIRSRAVLQFFAVFLFTGLPTFLADTSDAQAAECEFKTTSLESPGGPAQGFRNCIIGLKGYAKSMDIWRYLAISPNGGLLVTSNFGASARGADAGSRSFYFFPVTQKPAVSQNPDSKDVRVELASGQVLQLSGQDRRVLALTRAKIREAAEIHGSNQGGFEVEPHFGVMLDCGWRRGGDPIESAAGKCQVKTRDRASCSIPAQILRPLLQRDWPSPQKLNRAMSDLLTRHCPGVDIKTQMSPVVTPDSGSAGSGDSPAVQADPAR